MRNPIDTGSSGIEARFVNEITSSTLQEIDHDKCRHDIIGGVGIAEVVSTQVPTIMCTEVSFPPLRKGRAGYRDDVVAGGMQETGDCLQSAVEGVTPAATSPRIDGGGDMRGDRYGFVDEEKAVDEMALDPSMASAGHQDVLVLAHTAVGSMGWVTTSTRVDYTKKAVVLLERFRRTTGTPHQRWAESLKAYAPVSSSFYAMRAAMVWMFKNSLQRRLFEEGFSEPCGSENRLSDILQHLEIVQNLGRQDLLDRSGQVRVKKTSKKNDLPKLPEGWRNQLVDRAQSSTRYAKAIEILHLTGCRPEELRQGVTVTRNGQDAEIFISGAKVRARCGQKWRQVSVPMAALSPSLQRAIRGDRGSVRVTIASTGGLRDKLRRMSRALWPRGVVVTPYHFRHALAEDLRRDGWESHQIAEVLGQQSAKTQRLYGRKVRRTKGGPPQSRLSRGKTRVATKVGALPVFSPHALPAGAQKRGAKRLSVNRPKARH